MYVVQKINLQILGVPETRARIASICKAIPPQGAHEWNRTKVLKYFRRLDIAQKQVSDPIEQLKAGAKRQRTVQNRAVVPWDLLLR